MSILQRIELSFWHHFIPMIRESSTVRTVFPKIYPLISNSLFIQLLFPAAICALIGLFLGFIIGFVAI